MVRAVFDYGLGKAFPSYSRSGLRGATPARGGFPITPPTLRATSPCKGEDIFWATLDLKLKLT